MGPPSSWVGMVLLLLLMGAGVGGNEYLGLGGVETGVGRAPVEAPDILLG